MSLDEINRLKSLSSKDATVAQYFRFLDKGMKFEDMVVKLAIQLVSDKADARRVIRDMKRGKEAPTLIGLESME